MQLYSIFSMIKMSKLQWCCPRLHPGRNQGSMDRPTWMHGPSWRWCWWHRYISRNLSPIDAYGGVSRSESPEGDEKLHFWIFPNAFKVYYKIIFMMTGNRQDQRPFRNFLRRVIEVGLFYWTWLTNRTLHSSHSFKAIF